MQRRVRLVLGILSGLAVMSFAFNVYQLQIDSSGAFYLPFSRFWELLIGSLLALSSTSSSSSAPVRQSAGALGLLFMFASLVFVDKNSLLGLPNATFACLGAVLFIFAGTGDVPVANRLIGNPVFVYIGRISYSAYLWHWPLIVFYKLAINFDISPLPRSRSSSSPASPPCCRPIS